MAMIDPLFPDAEQIIIKRLKSGVITVDQENVDNDVAISLCMQAVKLITDEVFGGES